MASPAAWTASSSPVTKGNSAAEAKLRGEVERAAHTLEELARHRDFLGSEVTTVITSTVADVRRRLSRKELAVVVVGEKKAGKSTFLNAILGARVLGTAVRECTGTVTFIRRAARPTYRATLRNSEVIEFQDLEATERARLTAEAETLRGALGQDGRRPAPAPGRDIAATVAYVAAEHGQALQRRSAAERAAHDAQTRLAQAAAVAESEGGARASAASAVSSSERDVNMAQAELNSAEERLRTSESNLLQYARVAAPLLPEGAVGSQLAMAQQRLTATESRLAAASQAVPFFLRPAPWWQFWVFVLRVLLGWHFRERARALNVALAEERYARLVVDVCEASVRVANGKQAEARARANLERARNGLVVATERANAAGARRAEARGHLEQSQAYQREAQRLEELARLKLVQVRAVELEERFHHRFRSEVHDLTDMEKRGRDVVELTIGYPAVHLPDGLTIIDTPGVNTDNAPNRERAWEVIRRDADGCILVSDLQQVVSRSTRDFLQEVRGIIPHILLVMSKVDRALANAEDVGELDPLQQVEEARRTGVRRFAKEVGRAPDEVFSIAVAAEPALKGETSPDGLGQRFPAEVAKVFDLLQSERAIMLGARAASAIRYCVERIGEAQAQAEQKYNQRIAELEEQRLPDPREFQARQLAKVEDALQTHADTIARDARDVMSRGVDQVQEQWIDAIRACSSKDTVKATVAQLGQQGQQAMARVMSQVEQSVAAWSGEAIKDLEDPLLEELRERYRIVQRMTGSGMAVQLGGVGAASAATHATNLHAGVAGAVANFESEQFAIGAGGALAGAAIGTMVFPGIGTAVGAAIGALAGLFKTLDSLKSDCVREVRKGLGDAKQNLNDQLASVGPDVQRMMREVLARGLADAVARFQSWISQVMAAERKQIEQERTKLAHLIQSRDTLVLHDQSLATLQREAAAVSRGLCA